MQKSSHVIGILWLLMLTMAATAQNNAHTWWPDPSLAAQLGPEVTLDHCKFQLPPGFALQGTTRFASGRNLYVFKAQPHFIAHPGTVPNGFSPTIEITTETDQTAPPDWTVAQGVDGFVNDYAAKMIHGGFDKLTVPDIGLVGPLPAMRQYAKGDWDLDAHPESSFVLPHSELHRVVPVRLLVYGIGDSHCGTLALAYDLADTSPSLLPLMEASLLTLRHTDPPPALTAATAAPAPPGVWQPRADLLRFLGPETVTHGLALRVPQGYVPVIMQFAGKPDPSEPVMFGWQAADAQLTPMIQIVATPLPADQPPPALEDVMAQLAAQLGARLQNYTHSKPEIGMTGFGPTGRFYTQGTSRFLGIDTPKSEAVYVFTTRKFLVTIEAISGSDHSVSELDVMQTAILTGHPVAP